MGIEFEVVQFKRNKDMLVTAGELEAIGFMPANVYSTERHDYHCRCNTCQNIGERITYPLMFKMQRDASLPRTGAEFISSPFPVTDIYMADLRQALEILTANSIWTDERENERGDGLATPGFHVHVYSAGPELIGMDNLLERTIDRMYGFVPEIFTLANSAGVTRGIEFRIPARTGVDHHAWLALAGNGRNMERRATVGRLEWRIFEAPTDDVDYLIGSVYFAAGLSQLMHRQAVMSKLGAMTELLAWDDSKKTLEWILNEFSPERFELLKTALMEGTAVVTDDVAREQLERYLARV